MKEAAAAKITRGEYGASVGGSGQAPESADKERWTTGGHACHVEAFAGDKLMLPLLRKPFIIPLRVLSVTGALTRPGLHSLYCCEGFSLIECTPFDQNGQTAGALRKRAK